ncbi:uncharacterized protein MELLADRAFT_123844 [Melampsora larici-populina 98AG31]|uniref:Secreted protein n=1 Tax=Melampsora larici-populina (strain 98AG31 / pathotype 3-4-7) TaxID=747676 RepID=F4RBK9_MELLP|nr:uncharacterized protein MELLADRAFT_123844 [Melampsora larici-populina 98AG31]EGG10119.1 secreted protein [Melampsora larici-populina 98AG31]
MSSKIFLNLLVMCITLSVFMKLCSAKLGPGNYDCVQAYTTGHTAACTDGDGHQHNCPGDFCRYLDHIWLPMSNCVPYPATGDGFSKQQCEHYTYNDPNTFLCTIHNNQDYKCLRKLNDKPVMHCDNCST